MHLSNLVVKPYIHAVLLALSWFQPHKVWVFSLPQYILVLVNTWSRFRGS